MSEIIPFPGTCRHHVPDAPCDTETDSHERECLKLLFGNPKRKTHKQIVEDDLVDALDAYEVVFGFDHTREMILRFLESSK